VAGELNLRAIKRALAQVLARHQPLRLRLVDTPEGVRQTFPPVKAQDCVIRETAPPDGVTAREVACSLSMEPTDMRTHGAVQTWLIRSDAETLLLLLVNHLAIDAWGASLLAVEMWTCYAAATAGAEPPELPAPPRYADFVATQRAAALAWAPGQHEYWQRVCRDFCEPVVPPRPAAPAGPPDQPGRSDLVCVLPPEKMCRLTAFARAATVPTRTVEMAASLLAAWVCCPAPLVNAWCVHSGREDPAIAGVIGFFTRSFPLAVRIDPSVTLAEFTRNVVRSWSEAVGYLDPPYTAGLMRKLIAEAGGVDPAKPEIRLNAITPARGVSPAWGPVPVSDALAVEPLDLEAAQRAWYREPRLRLHSTFSDSLSIRAIFNPGMTPPDFAEGLMTTLDALLPQFTPENADRTVREVIDHV
jgi:pristinamycin I synthase-3/4